MPFQGDFNAAREIVRSGRLRAQAEQDLDAMLVPLRLHFASYPDHEGKTAIEAVENEKDRRLAARHHNEAQAELNRLHQEQMAEVKQMFAESNVDSDKKHAESFSISQEANALSRKAISVSQKSLAAAIVLGLAGVVVSIVALWHSDSGSSNVGKDQTQTKTTALPPETPQIVLPTPIAIQTNVHVIPVVTNVSVKK